VRFDFELGFFMSSSNKSLSAADTAANSALTLDSEIDELSIVNAITKLIFEVDEPLTLLERDVLALLPAADGLFVDCQPLEVSEYLRTFAKWELMNLVEQLKTLMMIDPETGTGQRAYKQEGYQH
jgi:hypothetical protein